LRADDARELANELASPVHADAHSRPRKTKPKPARELTSNPCRFMPPKIIDNPTPQEIIQADQERCAWATRAALAVAGPEPCEVYRPFFWLKWADRFGAAAEAAFRRLN
jgi:hypothetical protein